MRVHSFPRTLAATTLLASLLACGGAYTPPSGSAPAAAAPAAAATALAYTDPAGSGWRLVKDASSTPAHLVLNLLGPTGGQGRGVGFNLQSDGSVAFHAFADPTNTISGKNYVKPGTVYKLGLGPGNAFETRLTYLAQPVLAVGGVKQGGKLLTVGVYQKDRVQPAASFDSTPLLQIGLDLPTTGGPVVGQAIPLTMVRARAIPADIGQVPQTALDSWGSVIQKFAMEDIQIAVGSLHAQ